MLKKAFSIKIGSTRKVIAVNIVMITNAFIWYFYAFDFLRQLPDFNTLGMWAANFVGIAVAAILSTFFIERFSLRLSFLRLWMAAGVLLSFAPILASSSPVGTIVTSATVGAYFGFGMPICMGYFAAATGAENRARLGGITVLGIGVGVFLFTNFETSDAMSTSIILFAMRIVGLAAVLLLKPEEKPTDKQVKVSFKSVVSYRPFLLYLIPWIMFSLVNDMTFSVKSNFFPADFVYYSGIMENILAGVFAVAGGFFADKIGRKRLAVMGFALLGVGYAVLGFSQGNLFAWWFYTTADGIAWGAFYTIFLITIWGDLAQGKNSEKFYAIGSLPYLLSNFTRLTLGTYVAEAVPTAQVFSFASLFLFLAVLPLVFAPETLSEKIIKDRELKTYLEKAQEVAKKSQSNKEADKKCDADKDDEDETVTFGVNPEDDEKAQELAEKYY